MARPPKNKTSEAQLQAAARHQREKLIQVKFWLHKDGSDGLTPEMIKEAAADKGQSVNAYIIEAIKQRMARY